MGWGGHCQNHPAFKRIGLKTSFLLYSHLSFNFSFLSFALLATQTVKPNELLSLLGLCALNLFDLLNLRNSKCNGFLFFFSSCPVIQLGLEL